jgi:hypothetical protein
VSSEFEQRRTEQLRAVGARSLEDHRSLIAAHAAEITRLRRYLNQPVTPDTLVEHFDLPEFHGLVWSHAVAVLRRNGFGDDSLFDVRGREDVIVGVIQLHRTGLIRSRGAPPDHDDPLRKEIDAARAYVGTLGIGRRRTLAGQMHDRDHMERLASVGSGVIDCAQLAIRLLHEGPESVGLQKAIERGDFEWIADRVKGPADVEPGVVVSLRR